MTTVKAKTARRLAHAKTRARRSAKSAARAKDLRAARHGARRVLWGLSSLERVRRCGNSLSKFGNSDQGAKHQAGHTVAVKVSDGTAGFAGLQSCGSPWACPVCSQKISGVRADDVQSAVSAWHQDGGRVAFLTLTMRHRKGQRLDDLWAALSHGWDKATGGSGREWVKDCNDYGVPMERVVKRGKRAGEIVTENKIPFIRAVEVTHGSNGWHVHIHALLFVRDGVTDDDVKALSDRMFGRWVPALTDKGLTAPSQRHGVDIKLVRRGDSNALGDYFTKSQYVGRVKADGAGWELTGGAGKTARGINRTPFQILADIESAGDADDLALWWEFEKASRGKKQLQWSNGLRDYLDLGAEATDEEITDQDMGGEVVMTFSRKQWRVLRWVSCSVLTAIEEGADYQLIVDTFGCGSE